MRHCLQLRLVLLAVVAASSTLLGSAQATVTQPDGTVMPVLTTNNGEITLQQLFDFREGAGAIDAVEDASTEPSTFRPSCEFSAQFLLAEAGDRGRSVGWYNTPVTDTPPTQICDATTDLDQMGMACDGDEIYIIMPGLQAADDPIFSLNGGDPLNNPGAVFTAEDIITHPHYLGGEIGLVLNTQQKHYSEPRLNPVCVPNGMSCTAGEHWLPTVMYESTLQPNTFYMGVEDQDVGLDGMWGSNDGDFNDFTLVFTGLVCTGAGQLCDTGEPGFCATGITGCEDATGVSECMPTRTPGEESCNGLDDNCDDLIDEGDLCPVGEICDRGECRPLCGTGEFVCPGSTVCTMTGTCVDQECVDVACNGGEICEQGVCQGPCTGVVCPLNQYCSGGRCIDPCGGIVCEADEVCKLGVCISSCDCLGCESGLSCRFTTGECVAPDCVDTECAVGEHCEAGACVDDCSGVVCPGSAMCTAGVCGDPPTGGGTGGASVGGTTGSAGTLIDIDGGLPIGGAQSVGGTGPVSGGAGPATTGAGGSFVTQDQREPTGCGCRLPRRGGNQSYLFLVAFACWGAWLRRRRSALGLAL